MSMVADPRTALEQLFEALREHMEIALVVQDPDDDEVLDAAEALGDTIDEYDEPLYQAPGDDTPLDNHDGYDDDDDDDDEDDDQDSLDSDDAAASRAFGLGHVVENVADLPA